MDLSYDRGYKAHFSSSDAVMKFFFVLFLVVDKCIKYTCF